MALYPALDDKISDFGLNKSEIFSSLWNSLPPELLNKFYVITEILIAVLVAGLIYIILLFFIKLIGVIWGSREARNLKKVNGKLDEIISLMKKEKPEGKDKIEKKEKKNDRKF